MIPDEGFRKSEHILKSKDFRAVYKKGRSYRKSGFVLSVMPNDMPAGRLGFSISSANIKRACIRNRIRRLFREFYRKNKPRFKPAFDMVVIVKRNPGKKFLYEEAERLFTALGKEAGILL
ncbi:MAG: ribonuclease P protein component [Candidatus Omnitrophota bacterium]